MSRTVFPRIYTNLQSKVCFQFSFKVRRPVISTMVVPYMSFYEKREIINEIFDSWKWNMLAFFYFWKNKPKSGQIFQPFTLYSKGRHFSITKLDILIFCNVLHVEMDFWNLSWKRIVYSSNFWQKSCEKYYKWDIEKNGKAYWTASNLKTAYLWNFHFH